MSGQGYRWSRPVAIIGSARTPLCRVEGALAGASASCLAATAAREATVRAQLRPRQIDALVLGSTACDPDLDLARVVVLEAGLSARACSTMVSQDAGSSARAIIDAASRIALGQSEIVLAGGVERASGRASALAKMWGALWQARSESRRGISAEARRVLDHRFVRDALEMRTRLGALPQRRAPGTAEDLAVSSERVAKRAGVSRAEQDTWATRSHGNARRAAEAAVWGALLAPVAVGDEEGVEVVAQDDRPVGDGMLEWLRELPPLADAEHGSVTVGNVALPGDGAAMLVLADAALAQAEGWPVLAHLHAHAEVALDPFEHAWQAMVPAILRTLGVAGLGLTDLEVIEVYEPSAAAVLATLRMLGDPTACREVAGTSEGAGDVDIERVNAWGGAIALGNPTGAIAAHHVATCLARLSEAGASWGLVALSDAGGVGQALLLGAPDMKRH